MLVLLGCIRYVSACRLLAPVMLRYHHHLPHGTESLSAHAVSAHAVSARALSVPAVSAHAVSAHAVSARVMLAQSAVLHGQLEQS